MSTVVFKPFVEPNVPLQVLCSIPLVGIPRWRTASKSQSYPSKPTFVPGFLELLRRFRALIH